MIYLNFQINIIIITIIIIIILAITKYFYPGFRIWKVLAQLQIVVIILIKVLI